MSTFLSLKRTLKRSIPSARERVVHTREDFDIGGERNRTHGIQVELNEFAESSRVRLVHAPDGSHLIATERKGEIRILRHDTCERDGKIEPEGDILPFRVLELEDLLRVLVAVAQQRHAVFLGGGFERKETVAFVHLADGGDHLLPGIHLRRKVVPESFQEPGFDKTFVSHTRESVCV